MNPLLTNPMLAHNVQIFGMGIFNLGEFVESMCGVAWSYHATNFIQSDRRNHDYQIISILDPLPCHVSIHKHITSTNYLSEWSTQYTPKFKQNPPLLPDHKFKLAIGSKVQNPPPPLPSSTLLQSKTQKSMANNNTDLFNSLISDIKSYSGNDPLLPWLRYASLSFCGYLF